MAPSTFSVATRNRFFAYKRAVKVCNWLCGIILSAYLLGLRPDGLTAAGSSQVVRAALLRNGERWYGMDMARHARVVPSEPEPEPEPERLSLAKEKVPNTLCCGSRVAWYHPPTPQTARAGGRGGGPDMRATLSVQARSALDVCVGHTRVRISPAAVHRAAAR